MPETVDEKFRVPQTDWSYAAEAIVDVYGVEIEVEVISGRPKSLTRLKS